MTGVLAADPVAHVVSALLLVFGVGGQRVEDEDPGDQRVQDGREQQRQHEKHAKIKEVNGQIKLPGDSVAAGDDGDVVVHQLLDVRQVEPHHAVQRGESPDEQDDPLSSGQGAQKLSFNRVADSDVSLYGERGNGARGGVDPEILKVGDTEAPMVAKHPGAEDAVRDGGQASRCQHHQVGHSQTDQIAVGWSPHVFGGEHHQDDHHVANDS